MKQTIIIRELVPEEYEKYNIIAKEYGTVFDTLEWLQFFQPKVKIFGVFYKRQQMIGGFHLYHKKYFGILNIYRNVPYSPYTGIILKSNIRNPAKYMNFQKECLSAISEYIEKQNYHVITFSIDRRIIDTQPFIWNKFKVTPRYTYLIDLSESYKNIWNRMSPKRRNDILKSEKDGVKIQLIKNATEVQEIIFNTYYKKKLKFEPEILKNLFLKYFTNNNSFVYAAFKNTTLIAASLCLYDKNTAYYILGGIDVNNSCHSGGAVTLWNSIQHAQRLGLKWFDFEGSMVKDIEKYFRAFGGRLVPVFRISKARFLLELILKFKKREFF